MSTPSILLPDDDSDSFPSMPTMRAGGASRPGEPVLGRIDHYDLLRKLGGGGFGVVYLALDTVSGVEVALKTLHPLLKSNAEEMESLREKFALVSRLSHPNIATALVLHPVRDVNIWDETACKEMRLSPGDSVMVMRYAPGVTLSRWRRQFPNGIVPPDVALDIARQVASALDYAHGERIVHRDIKPGNIMVETLADNAECTMHDAQCTMQSRLRIRILDFGLAAEIRSSMSRVSTEQGDTSGTRPYMAPEQWLGRKQDGRTDQYALACVLYELLSGAPPFAGVFETGDPVIMMTTVENRAPDEIEDVPEAVNAALLQALAKKPKDRFPSCEAFVEAVSGEEIPRAKSATFAKNSTLVRDAPVMRPGGASRLGEPLDAAALEADVLRRKLALARAIKAISAEDRADSEFSGFIVKAEDELAVADEACKLGRFAAAVESLAASEMALNELQKARHAREEIMRKAKEEAARKAHEEAERKIREEAERKVREEAERKTRAEAERKAKEEAARKAHEEVERKLREEAERKVREEAERKARAEAERKVKEEAMRKAREEAGRNRLVLWRCFLIVASVVAISWARLYLLRRAEIKREARLAEIERKAREDADRRTEAINLGGGVELEMVYCPGVATDFWMGKVEVTQKQWQHVMGSNPSHFENVSEYPVESVSWNDCQEFVKKLNAFPTTKASGLTFRLPTEEEWETACRAGSTGTYCRSADGTEITSDTLGRVAWFSDNTANWTKPVGHKQPNAWGLYDMLGNVWEWTETADGAGRVYRGGGWSDSAWLCEASFRSWLSPVNRNYSLGFRLAASGRTGAK